MTNIAEQIVEGDLPYIEGAEYRIDEYGNLEIVVGQRRIVVGPSCDEGADEGGDLGYDATLSVLCLDGSEYYWHDAHTSHFNTKEGATGWVADSFNFKPGE